MSMRLLAHQTWGDSTNPGLLLLHGFLGCKEDWDEVAQKLSESFHVIAADLPGFGESISDLPEDSYAMPGCATAVVALLRTLGIIRSHLVGYSMGGRLALYLAVNHSEMCGRVIMESSSPGLRTEQERTDRRAHDEKLAQALLTEGVDQFLRNWYAQPMFASLRASAQFEGVMLRRKQNDPSGPARSLRMMGTGSQPSLWKELNSVSVPLLFLAGERDTKFATLAREMASVCPVGRAEVVEGLGHALHFEAPNRYIDIVRQFLLERK
jgi:2-succinyl-6-hydroxy-2,4-cyclohexadiene-1-carboxylate synthase